MLNVKCKLALHYSTLVGVKEREKREERRANSFTIRTGPAITYKTVASRAFVVYVVPVCVMV